MMNNVSHIEDAAEQYKQDAYGRHLRGRALLERAASGEPTDALAGELALLEIDAEQATIGFARQLSALSERELVELVCCSPEQYAAWRADDSEAFELVKLKHEIYRYIVARSPAIAAAREQHLAEISSGIA